MSFVPSAVAQAIAAAAGNNQAALAAPLTALQTSIAGGNLAPAALFDALRTANAWTEVGSGGSAPAFQNSWVNFGAPWNTAAFFKDALGFVHLKGLIKSGTVGTTAFTLPSGMIPTTQPLFVTISNNALGRVSVDTSGNIVVEAPSSSIWVSLEGLHFYAG